MCPPDETTYDYVQQRTDEPFEAQFADENASYIEEYRFDVSKIEPLVAAPHSPDNRKNARDCRDVKIDRVYIGWVAGWPSARVAEMSTSQTAYQHLKCGRLTVETACFS